MLPERSPSRSRARPWIVAAAVLGAVGTGAVLFTTLRGLGTFLTAPSPQEPLSRAVADYKERELKRGFRGPYFDDLTSHLDHARLRGTPLTRAEMLDHLGAPDLVAGPPGRRRYLYFYDRFGKKDWWACMFLSGERVSHFGYNATSELDPSQNWQPPPPKELTEGLPVESLPDHR